MKKSRYTEEQIVGVLKESEAGLDNCAASTASVSRRSIAGRRSTAVWRSAMRSGCGSWRTRTGSSSSWWRSRLWISSASRRRSQKVVGPQAEREAVKAFREAAKCSERRACGQMEIVRAMVRYEPRPTRFAAANEKLRTRLRELAGQRRRWRYRRRHVLLEREGWKVNIKRVYRICLERGLP